MSSSIQGTSTYFLELQQTADRLASSENPSPDEVQRLYDIVIELSQQGATRAEVDLMGRDIVAIQEEDEAEDVPPAIAPSAAPPAAQKHRHHHHHRHGLKKLAHKIGKFVRKHKTEIIIGAVVVAAVGVTAAAVGVASSAAAMRRKRREDGEKATGSHAHGSSIATALGRGFDEEAVLRSEGIRTAEMKAKEQRYPGLVHSVESMRLAQQKANTVLDKFKEGLAHSIGSKEVTEAVGVGLMLRDAALSIGSPAVAATEVILATNVAKNTLADYSSKVRELYGPAKEAYTELHRMQEANKQASLAKCTAEGYQPRLEFHPDSPQSGIDRSVLVDKNNPNPNEITVVLP